MTSTNANAKETVGIRDTSDDRHNIVSKGDDVKTNRYPHNKNK